MTLDNRLRCSRDLKTLGYQNGSGNIIGLPDQTIGDIADDILFFARERFDMIGIGPFIPHPATALSDCPPGNVEMVLKTIAVTRIITKDTHLPATTAIGSLNSNDYRPDALMAGANVLMPNFTPLPYRQLYEIYPGKRCSTEAPGTCGPCIDMMANAIGRTIDLSPRRFAEEKEERVRINQKHYLLIL
jgi:biotin synthase